MPIDDTEFQALKKRTRFFIQKQENDERLREDFLNSLLALPLTIEQRIALLAEQDKEGWTVGMTVVRYHRETAVQQYLVHHSIILGELHQDGKDVLLALALLMKKTATGWTLGHYIAYYESNQIVQQYIALLIHLHQAEVSGHNIMELFKLQMDNGWTVGHLIARHHDAATVQTYLKLLNTLLVANDWLEGVALAQDILALFKLRTKDGWTIIYPVGCQIARNHDVATLQVYFKLLSDLLAAGAPAQNILELFKLQTDSGWTIGHLNAPMNSYYREIEEEIKVNQKYASTHFHGASFFSAEFTKKFSSSYPKRNPLSPKKRCSINSVDPLAQSKSESEAFLLDLKKDTHIFSL